MPDIIDICGRILKLDELKYKGISRQEVNSSCRSTSVEKEILEGLQEAEKEVMKTVEKLGMLSLLIAKKILGKTRKVTLSI